jgi:hypothetical protein
MNEVLSLAGWDILLVYDEFGDVHRAKCFDICRGLSRAAELLPPTGSLQGVSGVEVGDWGSFFLVEGDFFPGVGLPEQLS